MNITDSNNFTANLDKRLVIANGKSDLDQTNMTTLRKVFILVDFSESMIENDYLPNRGSFVLSKLKVIRRRNYTVSLLENNLARNLFRASLS